MQRWRGVQAAPADWGRSVVTIGVYDGVHCGHQEIIRHTVARARALGLASVVVTFDPHPAEVARPGSHPAVLTEAGRKAELIERLGVDVLCVIPFTPEFSRLSAEAFVRDVLVGRLHASVVVVGENFHFGHRASGDVALLTRLGRTLGVSVEGAPLVGGASGDRVLSSTYIRACVETGDVAEAARVLGRPHRLEGVVVRGDQRGRLLGFPTANLLLSRNVAIPADGVYAGWLLRRGHDDLRLPAAISIGTNPTFHGRERRVEAYILDFDEDIYGERVALEFATRLRGMVKFEGVEPLIAQMKEDVVQARLALD